MKVFASSQARHSLGAVLNAAGKDKVRIRRRDGETFCLSKGSSPASPFDVPGVSTRATTRDIVASVRESRMRDSGR